MSAVKKAAAQVPVAAPLLVAVAAVAAAHVVIDLEAHEVGGEDAAQDLLAERQRLIDLSRREGRVQEPADLRLRMPAGHRRLVVGGPAVLVRLRSFGTLGPAPSGASRRPWEASYDGPCTGCVSLRMAGSSIRW